MTPMEMAVPHLDKAEIARIARDGAVSNLDPQEASHLESCDECLMRLADCVTELASEEALREGAAPSLRAVNLAAARWRADLARTTSGETADAAMASPEARMEVLLGPAAGPAQTQSPLLALFVGKRQARS